jgi:hypothetical protein
MPPSRNNGKSNFVVVEGVAWWHPEEIPWLSRSISIMPLPAIMTNTFFLLKGWHGGTLKKYLG